MAGPVGNRVILVCAKAEATPGTAETLAGTDALRIPDWSEVTPPEEAGGEAIQRMLMHARGDYSSIIAPIGRFIQHSIPMELFFPVSKGVVTEQSSIAEATGYVETLVGGTSTTWNLSGAPSSAADIASATLGFYTGPSGDGKRWIVNGCRGQLEITFPHNGPQRAVWNYMGGFADPTDQTVLTPTYNAGIPICGAVTRTFSLTDGSTTWDDELVVRSAKYTTPFTCAARPDMSSTANATKGHRLPPHMMPGIGIFEIEVESAELALVPVETWLSQGPNAALITGAMAWTDNDGALNHVCTDTFRGMRLLKKSSKGGAPMTDVLTFACAPVGANASHTRAMT